MKKIGVTLLAAFIGGAVAVGGYKLIEDRQTANMSLEERQKVYFANNPQAISSAGDVDFVQAAAAVTPGVVHIKTTYEGNASSRRGGGDPFEDMFRDFFGTPRGGGGQRAPQMASGSGVIVTDDGYIVTNNHVVENATKIDVILPDKRAFEAKIVGRDPNTDLAVIKVEGSGLPVVKLGNSDQVQVGEWVLAIGYPFTLNTTVTAGIVSAKGRSIGILGEQQQRGYADPNEPRVNSAIEAFIQTDAAINRGNSGGALVNTRGELIGINAAIASQSGNYEGYGFAIPINLAKKIMDDFIKFGSVKRGLVGITFRELDATVAKELGVNQINGLYVNTVVPNGGAAAAGIKEGDIITKVEGNRITSSADLQERVARLRPGDKVQLTYERGGNERNVTVTLKGEGDLKIAKNTAGTEDVMRKLGGTFAPLTAAQKQKYKVNSGVIVAGTRENGLLEENGITKGTVITSINGRAVSKPEDVSNALKATQNNVVRINGILPDGSRIIGGIPVVQ
ncbi:Do family serine endopeptidase [Pedobacter sp. SYSU D00535]|uniref:Do family serine endopeptidase n=1 Tax=Pedobacter sp. SYSU D00535 TaxID=2810308 RepID=UPI001A9739F5|nr:Do family serine endopeptidase [Pedobacter sp. SYSU D00535]